MQTKALLMHTLFICGDDMAWFWTELSIPATLVAANVPLVRWSTWEQPDRAAAQMYQEDKAQQQGSLSYLPNQLRCRNEKISVCRALGCKHSPCDDMIPVDPSKTIFGTQKRKRKILNVECIAECQGLTCIKGEMPTHLESSGTRLSTRNPSVTLSCNCNSKTGMTATSEGLISSNPDTWKPDPKVIHLCWTSTVFSLQTDIWGVCLFAFKNKIKKDIGLLLHVLLCLRKIWNISSDMQSGF